MILSQLRGNQLYRVGYVEAGLAQRSPVPCAPDIRWSPAPANAPAFSLISSAAPSRVMASSPSINLVSLYNSLVSKLAQGELIVTSDAVHSSSPGRVSALAITYSASLPDVSLGSARWPPFEI